MDDLKRSQSIRSLNQERGANLVYQELQCWLALNIDLVRAEERMSLSLDTVLQTMVYSGYVGPRRVTPVPKNYKYDDRLV